VNEYVIEKNIKVSRRRLRRRASICFLTRMFLFILFGLILSPSISEILFARYIEAIYRKNRGEVYSIFDNISIKDFVKYSIPYVYNPKYPLHSLIRNILSISIILIIIEIIEFILHKKYIFFDKNRNMINMTVSFNDVEKNFIERISMLTSNLGIGKAAGKIWGTLILAGIPLSQQEIKSLTDYSLSMISSNLSLLEKYGFVRKIGKSGKKILYKSNTDIIDLMEFYLKNIIGKELPSLAKYVSQHINDFSNQTRRNAEKILNECRKSRYILNFLIKIIDRFRDFTLTELLALFKR